jgi:hypothetical protein
MNGSVERFRRPLVVLAASGLIVTACEQPEPAGTPVDVPPAVETPAAPLPAPVITTLDRKALLDGLRRAASTYASGAPAEGTDPFVGKRFSVAVAFGCVGPEPGTEGMAEGLARWSWAPERRAVQLSMTPGDWTGSALIAGTGEDSWEAVEGFWITRPWMEEGGCPAPRADPLASGPVAPSPQTVGLAAVFEADGSRLERRNGRAYAFSVRPEGEAETVSAPDGGFRLRLQGRIGAFPDGRAIRCRAAGPDQRPVCIAAVRLDRVAFEDARGETLSEWRVGG